MGDASLHAQQEAMYSFRKRLALLLGNTTTS